MTNSHANSQLLADGTLTIPQSESIRSLNILSINISRAAEALPDSK